MSFQDFHAAQLEIREKLDSAYKRVIESGSYILGNEVAEFEREFAQYCGTKFCIGVGSGFDALVLAFQSLKIGVNDEVIVPANTYTVSWMAISQVGAIPIPVEPDPYTKNIDPHRIAEKISEQTKAILVVHLYGMPADMRSIIDIAKENDLPIIEDAAQAHGSKYYGHHPGWKSSLAAYSFYPTKNLGSFGDAGAVVTNDPNLASKIKTLRNYGKDEHNEFSHIGVNSKLDELQAGFLREKLGFLDEWNNRRRKIANKYLNELAELTNLDLPTSPDGIESNWHIFTILHKQRNALKKYLLEKGIETMIHYPTPPHLSKAYRHLRWKKGSFPITENIANNILSLPMHAQLSEEKVNYVIKSIILFDDS